MQTIRVLLVEDDPSLRMVIGETLELEGFSVASASDGIEGLLYLSQHKVDVMVADIMMPNLDGLEMVRRIRSRDHRMPILFLSAKSTVDSVVEGFESGADDYLRKPFSMKELIVRIIALHSRNVRETTTQPTTLGQRIHIGIYSFDPVNQTLSVGGAIQKLSSKESEILRMLSANINEVVNARTLMTEIWGDDSHYISKSLQVFITKLRQMLQEDPTVSIINARGEGYKLLVGLPE